MLPGTSPPTSTTHVLHSPCLVYFEGAKACVVLRSVFRVQSCSPVYFRHTVGPHQALRLLPTEYKVYTA